MGATKIGIGHYRYKGYELFCYGYYSPDHCIWWEAINEETGCADYHEHTKKELMAMIDSQN